MAPAGAIAREPAAGVVTDYGRKYDSAARLLHGRLRRSLHRAPTIPASPIAGRSRTTESCLSVCSSRAPPPQNHPQRLRRASCPEADVWRADPRRRAMAFGQSHRVRTSPAGFCQKRSRSGIRDYGQPQYAAFKGCKPRQNIQQFSALTYRHPGRQRKNCRRIGGREK